MNLETIRSLIADDMQAVDSAILESLHSDIPLIAQIGHHIVNSGGKRIRPMVVLLSAMAIGFKGQASIELAAIIEFIHTATLLHDDVVDHSALRRGKDTANAIWGNSASVLVGDFVYSRSFQMMVKLNNLNIMRILADTTNRISEGEVLQLLNRQDPATTEASYMAVIDYKTATLFSAAARLGAVVATEDETVHQAFHDYGTHLGIAYQLVDDVLDYSDDDIGKNIGDDLAEGKPTLPLIHALRVGNEEQVALIEQAIKQAKADDIAAIKQVINDTKALDYTYDKAKQHVDHAITALQGISDNPAKQSLIGLVEFVIARHY